MALTRINNQALTNVTSAGLPTLDHDKLPTGSTIQIVQGTPFGGGNASNRHISLSVPNYSNNKANLRHIGSTYDVSLTTKRANSKFLITVSATVSADTTSHMYLEQKIYHGSTNQGWASEIIGGSGMGNDGLTAGHRDTVSQVHKEAITYLYSPSNVAKGTVIKLETYIGNWVATTMRIGAYTGAGNNNANDPAVITITEIAG